MVTNIFAHLPNGIIREIISYTGATYKKRNGKYIGQIPKNDPRYAIIKKIPRIEKKSSFIFISNNGDPDIEYLCCEVNLTRHRYDYIHAYLKFVSVKTTNRSKFSSENDFTYSFHISSLNHDPNVPYLREYTFREGDVVEKIKNYEISGRRIRFLLEIIWLVISCSVGYYLGLRYK